MAFLLDDFAKRSDVFIHQVLGTTTQIEFADGSQVESHVGVQGCEHFLECDWTIFGVLGQAVGGANHREELIVSVWWQLSDDNL